MRATGIRTEALATRVLVSGQKNLVQCNSGREKKKNMCPCAHAAFFSLGACIGAALGGWQAAAATLVIHVFEIDRAVRGAPAGGSPEKACSTPERASGAAERHPTFFTVKVGGVSYLSKKQSSFRLSRKLSQALSPATHFLYCMSATRETV